MRNLAIALVFAICVGLPQTGSAEDPAQRQFRDRADHALPSSGLAKLLQNLGVDVISKARLISEARAAECTEEGETCASTEQCCPGLQCAGGPPATCTTED